MIDFSILSILLIPIDSAFFVQLRSSYTNSKQSVRIVAQRSQNRLRSRVGFPCGVDPPAAAGGSDNTHQLT